jgi:replicative DNA helicase
MKDFEKIIIGTCLASAVAAKKIVSSVSEEMFSSPQARGMFKAIRSIVTSGDTPSFSSVSAASGVPSTVAMATMSEADTTGYAGAISDMKLAYEQEVLIKATNIITSAIGNRPASEIKGLVTQQLSRLSITESSSGVVFERDAYVTAFAEAEARRKAGVNIMGTPCGIKHLDEALDGFMIKKHIHIAARPSMGKTALALQIADSLQKNGANVGFVSLETHVLNMIYRQVSRELGCSVQAIRKGAVTDEVWARFKALSDQRSRMERSLFYVDEPGLTLENLLRKIAMMKDRYDLTHVLIDYLQLITMLGGPGKRNEQIKDIAQGLTDISKSLNICVASLGQLGRSVETVQRRIPSMAHLAEGSAIEAAIDACALLYRPAYYGYYRRQDGEPYAPGHLDIIVVKNKDGPTGTIEGRVDLATNQFFSTIFVESGSAPTKKQTTNVPNSGPNL